MKKYEASRTQKEVDDAYERIHTIIWFNRHKATEKKGKPKHISQKNWDAAVKQAKEVETKIPRKELFLSDFEWGCVTGRFMMLNWLGGEEWDSAMT